MLRTNGGVVKKLVHPRREDLELSAVLDALADPVRLCVVGQLWDKGECTCSTFDVKVVKSTLSHHFKVLRDAGIVMTRINGTEYGLSIRTEDLEARFPGLISAIMNGRKKGKTATIKAKCGGTE